MNKAFIIGNLTADPKGGTTANGVYVCHFTVAVNRRMVDGQTGTDFFRVNAWRKLGENCARYLAKGKKVNVVGSVSASAYTNSQGQPAASIELNADDVEFLSPADNAESQYRKEERQAIQQEPQKGSMVKNAGGFIQVNEEDLPF